MGSRKVSCLTGPARLSEFGTALGYPTASSLCDGTTTSLLFACAGAGGRFGPTSGSLRTWPQAATVRWMRRLGVLVLLTLLAGCGGRGEGDGGDKAAFCGAVKDYAEAVKGIDKTDFDSLESGLAASKKAYSRMKDTAPGSLKGPLDDLDKFDSDSIRLSEQKRYAAAQDKINSFVRKGCDLDVSL